jgi:hypothetical protein
MHPIGEKNKYIGFLFMKLKPEYFTASREEVLRITLEHARDLVKYTTNLTHVITSGTNANHDQISIIEADSLEGIYDATMEFRMGAKAAYIDVVDVVVGIKAPPISEARLSKLREQATKRSAKT